LTPSQKIEAIAASNLNASENTSPQNGQCLSVLSINMGGKPMTNLCALEIDIQFYRADVVLIQESHLSAEEATETHILNKLKEEYTVIHSCLNYQDRIRKLLINKKENASDEAVDAAVKAGKLTVHSEGIITLIHKKWENDLEIIEDTNKKFHLITIAQGKTAYLKANVYAHAHMPKIKRFLWNNSSQPESQSFTKSSTSIT
jgi:hypothetical protein